MTLQSITQAVQEQGGIKERALLLKALESHKDSTGAVLQDQALEIIDQKSSASLLSLLNEALAEVTAPAFKQPANLAWVAQFAGFPGNSPEGW